jgi:GntR family transcriptional regulator/MocR family aminotransferase
MITRGSQMALDLLARVLVRPGDVVAVEALGYPNAVNVFRKATPAVAPIGVDDDGLDVAALADLARRHPVRALYLTPQHQYPTTVMLSPTRRLALLALARRHDLAVIEDDFDHEFHFDGRPVLPLAAADGGRNVIYVGTFAKILAPGLRLGFVTAPPALVARLAAERALVDGQGDGILECAIAELLDDGEVQRLARRSRRIYAERREALCAAIDDDLAEVLSYRRPAGGLALWARAAPCVDVEAWRARCAARESTFRSAASSRSTAGPRRSCVSATRRWTSRASPGRDACSANRFPEVCEGQRATGRPHRPGRRPADGRAPQGARARKLTG